MRDVAIVSNTQPEQSWYLDIDIEDGYPRLLGEGQTPDQRAAIAAVQMLGTIPGMLDTGVDWSQMYVNDYQDNIVNIDNQVKRAIQDTAYAEGPISQQYCPQYTQEDGQGIGLTIIRLGGNND